MQGCKRKFDVQKFVNRYPPAAANANTASSSSNASSGSSGSKGGASKKTAAAKGQKGIDAFLTKKWLPFGTFALVSW